MKSKIIAVILLIAMVLSLLSCGGNNTTDDSKDDVIDNVDDNKDDDKEESIVCIKQGETDKMNNYLRLFGRTYYSNGRLALDHSGTGFEMKTDASNVSIDIVATPSTSILNVFLDGVSYKSIKISRNGTLNIASNLQDGPHLIRVIKSSSTAGGVLYVNSITTDGNILKHDKEYKLNIEFVGDSITCGAGVLTTPEVMTNYSNSDVTKAYSYICASKLDAAFSIVATEGICVKQVNTVGTNSLSMYKWYSLNNRTPYTNNTKNDFVVVNLGANDEHYVLYEQGYADQFYGDYLEFINMIREYNPESEIICIYGHTETVEKVRSDIKKVVADLNKNGDSHIHYFQVSSDMGGGGYHPGMEGAQRQGMELYKYIKENFDIPDTEEEIEDNRPFIDGKKLVLLGDSISALGTWGEDTAKDLNMYFYNAAMGGITSREGIERFNVFVKNSGADFVTILFGQNDLIMNTYNTPKVTLEEFKQNLITMVNLVRNMGATPILLTTNPLNPDIFWTAQGQKQENYTEVGGDPLAWLDCYNAVTREVAKETECDLVDMRNQFSQKYYRNALSDGIHLNARGNEIFKTALIEYFLGKYRKDPNASPIEVEDRNIYVESGQSVDIISKDASDWYLPDSKVMKVETNGDSIEFYNTNGLWPDAQYTHSNPIVIDYNTGYLYYDVELKNISTSIIIFINGSTPAAYKNGEYFTINNKISDKVNEAGDVVGPVKLSGKIKLTDFNIGKAYLSDGKLIISGVKVFAAGTSNQKVIINDLHVAIEE